MPGSMTGSNPSPDTVTEQTDSLIKLLAAAAFIIFFQAYMVAPLIPRLATVLGASPEYVGLSVPAYLIPYGIATLVFGVLSDRVGRGRMLLSSLVAFTVLTAATASAGTASGFIAWRLATGLGASAIVPVALAYVGADPVREAGPCAGLAIRRHGRRDGIRINVRSAARTAARVARPVHRGCCARGHPVAAYRTQAQGTRGA
jgi:hypothetical protein